MVVDLSGNTSVDIAYINGVVLPSATAPSAQAILIQDGLVAKVGTNEEILEGLDSSIKVQDINGAVITPGLIDTHPHLLHFAAARAPLVNLLNAKSHEEIIQAITKKAATLPKGEWIPTSPIGDAQYFVKRSYRDLKGGMPDRHVLDKASTEHPILIQAWAPVCPNITAFNSLALKIVGIDSSTPDRVGDVWIEKDSNGEPTGVLRGMVNMYYNFDEFWSSIRDKVAPYIQPHLVPQGVVDAIANYNKDGFTTIFESHAMEPDHIGVYQLLREKGLLNVRVMASSELEGNALPGCETKSVTQIQETLEHALAATDLKDDWLRIEGVTTCVWGIPTCHGLCWKDGYVGPFGERTTGVRNLTEEKLQLAFDFCAKNSLRLNLLATSPDEIDEYIDKTEKVMKKYKIEKTGWLIEHAMIIREGQAEKLHELGFDVTVNIGHTYGVGDLLEERVGPKALEGLNALRELLDSGLKVGSCLDWGPMDPWECLQLSITHQMFPSGRLNNGKRQVITQREAFDTFTEQAAAVMRWEHIGALKPGYHADLIIIDRNPISCSIDELAGTKVLRTTVGGRIVWNNGEISEEN